MSEGRPLGRLEDFPDGAATPARYRKGERDVAIPVIRRGADLRAYVDECPHQFLPLTWRGGRVLSADRGRLRCSNHGAEFAVEDGRGVSGPGSACGLTPVPLRVDPDGTVRVDDDGPSPMPG